MRSLISHLLLLAGLLACSACTHSTNSGAATGAGATVAAPLPSVDDMVRRMMTQDGAKDFTAEMRMTARGADGKSDQVEFRIQRKNDADRSVSFFTVLAPREETGKAILAIEKADQATEAMSYLAGLRRLARMNSARQLDFRGARVTVQELLGMELGQYAHGEAERVADGGESLIKVEFKGKPDRSLAFPRIVGYFHEKDRSPARFDLYDEGDQLLKKVAIQEVKTVQNRQTITRVGIEDLSQKLRLELETRRVEYDRGIADRIFTEDYLKSFVTEAGQKLIQ